MNRQKRLILYTTGELLLYAAVSALFLSFASYFTSPLTGIYGSDSAFFQMVGQAMTKGMLPYRDFFDMKGPYFFLLQHLAQLICYGRLGCFILQIVNLTIALWFGCRCIRLARKKRCVWLELLMLIPCAIVLTATLDGGNLTEEFALPSLLASLYLCLRCFHQADGQVPAYVGFLCGVFFCLNALSRITNAAFLCAVVFTLVFHLLLSRQYRMLWHNAAAFIAGCLLTFLPIAVFYAGKGLLSDMLKSVFSFGASYATEGGIAQRFSLFAHMLGWELMLLLPAAVLLLTGSKNRSEWILALSSFCITSLIFLFGNAYVHYFTLVVPSLVYAAHLYLAHPVRPAVCAKRWMAAGLLLCLFLGGVWLQKPAFSKARTRISTYLSQQAARGYSWQSISGIAPERQGIAALIPEEDLGSVYAYGLPMDFFCQMDFFPCYKYCCWQDHYVELEPSIGEQIRTYFAQTPPKWFLVRSSYTVDTLPEYFGDLTNIYEEHAVSGDFKLLKRLPERDV